VAFARRFRDETGCLLAEVGCGRGVTPERFEHEAAATFP
jgi:hypothetical protein